MKRLFISLYLVVVLALLLIGWSTDSLWRLLQSNSDSEITKLAKLTKLARVGGDIEFAHQQQRLTADLDMPIGTIEFGDVAWLAEQVTLLEAGEPVLMYDSADRLLIYLRLSANTHVNSHVDVNPHVLSPASILLQFGPIDIAPSHNQTARALYFMSYLLLAVAIGLWSRPLWRDLSVLQRATESFGKGHWQQTPKVGANSVIAPVVDTFKEMSARIGRLVAEQKELTNAVSHELRTPLSRLKFSLALFDTQGGNDGHKQIAQGMSADVNELEALVDEMLSYSRLESEARQLVLLEVDIHQLLSNLVEKLSLHCEHQIEHNLPEEFIWVCDGHFVERAMQNLITNAIRYGHSKVFIDGDLIADELYLSVIDDGQGIDMSQVQEVFKPFVRLDKSRTKDKGGFGLGLAIVKRIADWHQGRVMVCQSTVDGLGGAKFSFILPRAKVNSQP